MGPSPRTAHRFRQSGLGRAGGGYRLPMRLGRNVEVRPLGGAPGCVGMIVASIVVSVLLTVILNLVVR